jgi:hypothetical protein
MNKNSKRNAVNVWLFAVVVFLTLAACKLFGEDEYAQKTRVAANIFASQTAAPTPTPIPPTATNTPVPKPSSGEVIYQTDFSDFSDWDVYTQNDENDYEFEYREDGLFVRVPLEEDYLYAYYDLENGNSDVRIEADIELVGGSDYTYISLVCRSSNEGEYNFFIDAGGYWGIDKYDFDKDEYEELAYALSKSIKVDKAKNNIIAICDGDTLSMIINGTKVGEVQDSQYTSGQIGIGIDTFDNPLAEVMFYNLEVSIP